VQFLIENDFIKYLEILTVTLGYVKNDQLRFQDAVIKPIVENVSETYIYIYIYIKKKTVQQNENPPRSFTETPYTHLNV
jgi:hypothetical protein